MTAGTNDLVGRLHRRLLEEVARRGAGRSFTIAELYQQLIPYRGVRGDLGVLELAEYEHALLRLLSGERGLLRMADEGVRQELAAELSSPNPILGVYRDYSAATLELATGAEPDDTQRPPQDPASSGEPPAGQGGSQVLDMAELMDDDQDASEDTEEWPEDPPPLPELTGPAPRPFAADATRVANRPVPPEPPRPVGLPTLSPARCSSCDGVLPDVDGLRFCPHCGTDQTAVPCDRCASPIRAEWNFCIRCGTRRPLPSRPD